MATSVKQAPLSPASRPVRPLVSAELPLVHGRLCQGGHFNHPDAAYCAECGMTMARCPSTVVERPRPAVGVLVINDGRLVTLDRSCVVGRGQGGEDSRPPSWLVIDPTVEEIHAEIRVQGWDVSVADLGSAAGTFVARGSPLVWSRLAPREPMPISSPTLLRFGETRIIAFEPRFA